MGLNLTGVAEPEEVSGMRVSVELFPVLGVQPSSGRHFGVEEGRVGSEPVVILSDGLWRRRFGADPGLLGNAVELSGRAHTVVGIMPSHFQFGPGVDLWTPMRPVVEATDRPQHQAPGTVEARYHTRRGASGTRTVHPVIALRSE